MNMEEQIHNVRKEYWRTLIRQCDASGKLQKDWCQENGICSTSMSTWRSQLRREEAAEKEFAAAKEEHCFVEIKAETEDNINEGKALTLSDKAEKCVRPQQAKEKAHESGETRLMKPDAVIGYREYMIGVYEDTSEQLLRKVVEVLRYA